MYEWVRDANLTNASDMINVQMFTLYQCEYEQTNKQTKIVLFIVPYNSRMM